MEEKILVVDDEKSIADAIAYGFRREGYIVTSAYDGKEALEKLSSFQPNLIILDIMMPKMNGFEVCKKLSNRDDIGIILLTAKDDIVDKVLGLEIGADDYICKPFHIKEVIARVNKSLERIEKVVNNLNKEKTLIEIGEDTYLDDDGRVVIKNATEISLRPKEFELLYLLATNKGKVFSREQLLDKIWSYDYFGDLRTVDVHIRRLRAKIEDVDNKYIETVFGVGYKLR